MVLMANAIKLITDIAKNILAINSISANSGNKENNIEVPAKPNVVTSDALTNALGMLTVPSIFPRLQTNP